jgi:hypothetical protein
VIQAITFVEEILHAVGDHALEVVGVVVYEVSDKKPNVFLRMVVHEVELVYVALGCYKDEEMRSGGEDARSLGPRTSVLKVVVYVVNSYRRSARLFARDKITKRSVLKSENVRDEVGTLFPLPGC